MKILVCVKLVPDAEGRITPDKEGKWISLEGISFRLNRFDEYAVEEALRIREAFPGSTVDAVTVGAERAAAAVRRALEMGADNGVHVVTGMDTCLPPRAVAALIAFYAKERNYDLVLCGVMSEDMMHAATGPVLAGMLAIPSITSVISCVISTDGKSLEVEREIEGGIRERYHLVLPALLTVQSGINRPRYPSLSGMLRAKKQEITRLYDHNIPGASVRKPEITVYTPEKTKKTVFMNGDSRQKAAALAGFFRDRSFI